MSYLKHLLNLRFVLAGIVRMFSGEKSFHMMVAGSVVLSTISILLGTPLWRLAIILFGFLLALSVEMLNTAIEVSGDKHDTTNPIWLQGRDEHIRDMKNIAAAAVFFVSLGALILWAGLTFAL